MNQQQQAVKQPQAPTQGSRPEAILVKTIKFVAGEHVDLPGKLGANSLTANPEAKPGQKRWQIDYEPAKRHHRVTFWDAGDAEPQVQYVHETWVTWAV